MSKPERSELPEGGAPSPKPKNPRTSAERKMTGPDGRSLIVRMQGPYNADVPLVRPTDSVPSEKDMPCCKAWCCAAGAVDACVCDIREMARLPAMSLSASISGGGLTKHRADDWVALVRPFFERLHGTEHIATPLEIVVEGDTATCVSLLHVQHHLPNEMGGDVQRLIGYYENTLARRTPDGWKVAKCVQFKKAITGIPQKWPEFKNEPLAIPAWKFRK